MKTVLADNLSPNEELRQSALWKCLEFFKWLNFSGTDSFSQEMRERQKSLWNWTWELSFTVGVEPFFGGGFVTRLYFKVNEDLFFPDLWWNWENIDKLMRLLTDEEIASLLILWSKEEVLKKEERILRSMWLLRFREQDTEFHHLDVARKNLHLVKKYTSNKARRILLKTLKK